MFLKIEKYLTENRFDDNFGNWSSILDEFKYFDDYNGSKRVSEYIYELISNINKGDNTQNSIYKTNKKFIQRYGPTYIATLKMINFRIIPKLEIKNENLVKGVNHEGLRVLGDPLIFISEYLENNADEIFLQDVTASLYETKISPNFIDEILKKTFVPVLFGGGISSIDDVSLLLKLGIDRFSINTACA